MAYTAEVNKRYLKDRYYAQRAEFLAYLGGVCARCGVDEDLQIDHVDRSQKSFPVARLWPVNKLPAVYEELKKCQALCRACHLTKTIGEMTGEERGFQHGSMYGWMKKRCTCSACRSAKDVWNAARRERRAQARTS